MSSLSHGLSVCRATVEVVLMVACALSACVLPASAETRAATAIRGKVGVGTWRTRAEFRDIRVTQGDRVLLEGDVPADLAGWELTRGSWEAADGAIRQTSGEDDAIALIGEPDWHDYTLTLKARKLGGNEGFLIAFGMPDAGVKSRWNIGGWRNTRHAIQADATPEQSVDGKIETNRWYDIKVVLEGHRIRAYLDGQLVHDVRKIVPRRDFGRALIPDLVADPSIAEFEGVFYCYCTTDGMGAGLETAGLPVVWESRDFLNWRFSGSLFPPSFDAKYWAPSAPVLLDGRTYLFPTLDERITAVVSGSPKGPFRTLEGKEATRRGRWRSFPITTGKPIDAEVFRDDDGTHYMVWAQRYIARLTPDLAGLDGDPMPIETKRGGYSEGPYLLKRNGIYYYLYTLGGHEGYQYAYMMSRESVLGPWEAPEQDIIATTDRDQGVVGPGHGCVFSPDGSDEWVFVYLEYGRSGTNRQVHAARMVFNHDGTIHPIQLSLAGIGALRPDPNYARPNLALGASVSASSVRAEYRVPTITDPQLSRVEGYAAENAVDDSNGSRWLAAPGDKTPWLSLDLGEAREVQRVESCFVTPTRGHAYKLESSPDGETWQPCGGHSDVRVQSPHTDAVHARIRYLRVSILQGAPGLWELRVY